MGNGQWAMGLPGAPQPVLSLIACRSSSSARCIEQIRRREPSRAEALGLWLADLTTLYSDRVLAIDSQVADDWGRLRAVRSLPVVDALLAATARVHGLTIVTRNERDFAGLGVTIINPG
jgi:predicted nucleic acid-binding protein